MKKFLILMAALTLLPAFSFADMSTDGHKTELGFDVEMPYVISVGGSSAGDRGDTLMGVHGNYFMQPEWSIGLQLDFGVETQAAGADNAFIATPGPAWHFMPGETLNPYVRFDVPLYLTGGSATGDGFDAGISGGLGAAWNLSELTGANGLSLKYDTALNYLFDAEALSINIFRLALAYAW